MHGGDERAHPFVVRGCPLELVDELPEQVCFPLLAGNLGQLLLDLDALGRLSDRGERAREEGKGVEVLRVGLEAELQLRQRLHPVVLRVAREIELGGDAGMRGVGLVMEEPLDHLERVVPPPQAHELRRGEPELGDGGVEVLHARKRLRQAEVRQRIRRIELDNLPEDVDRLLVYVLPVQARSHLVERREGVAREPQLLE